MRITVSWHRGLIWLVAAVAILSGVAVWAATKSIDLDKNTTTESAVSLDVNSATSPPTVTNTVTDKAIGMYFTFNWVSAGPGGWVDKVGPGSATGVGKKWSWQSSQAIYSFTGSTCANDICFTQTDSSFNPIGTAFGGFRVPGRSLSLSGVTLSNASLTSSNISFFSPPKVVFSATSRVGQVGAGQVSFNTTLQNDSGNDLTVHVDAGPPGCCPHENQLNCSGTCVDYLTDPNNCGGCGVQCAVGQLCDNGVCRSTCAPGQTQCGTVCVDLTSDPLNCGACNHACGTNQICTGSACVTCKSPTQTACDNQCVNIHTDPSNCGACGVDCNALCPSTGQGACSQGNSCFCISGSSAIASPATAATLLTTTTLPPPAPVCLTQASTQTIPAGTSQSLPCNTAGYLAREVLSIVRVCDGGAAPDANGICPNGNPAAQGPFNQLVPDTGRPVGTQAVLLTPGAVSFVEPSGTGMWLPGEFVQVNISLNNVGFSTLNGACAKLSSPPQDITVGDNISNPTSANITVATACYPDVPGLPTGSTDCNAPSQATAVRGLTPFTVSVPADYIGDTSRVFILHVTGTAGGAPVSEDVPLTLGVAGLCDPANIQGDFDGLVGLASPMAALIPEGDSRPLSFPNKPFSLGKTRPLKLNFSCGGLNLDSTNAVPPQITALFNLTTNQPVDITKVNINDSPNLFDPLFRYNTTLLGWIYQMRTKDLSVGRYRITIKIDGQINYVTGFELN
jgi:Stigma-specific protein, Stig1